jgi:hypothetical protein
MSHAYTSSTMFIKAGIHRQTGANTTDRVATLPRPELGAIESMNIIGDSGGRHESRVMAHDPDLGFLRLARLESSYGGLLAQKASLRMSALMLLSAA